MKQLWTLLVGLSFVAFSIAQKDEAHIIYDIHMESSQPEIQAQLGMLAGSSLEVMYKGSKSRQSMSMGSFITTTTISDQDSGEAIMLMSGMMGKSAAKMNINDMKDEEDEQELEFELTDETKKILGYTCYKAILETEEGLETIFWYTKELTAPKGDSEYFRKEIPGMPLEFSINTPEMQMSFVASQVNEKVKKPKEVFSMDIPEGYAVRSIEELQGAFGGQ